jgi:hypothetical protein
MRILHLTARSASDGQLHLHIPAEADTEFEVAVVVQPKVATNGIERKLTPEELGWPPGYFEATYGSIQDEAFKRYPQGEPQVREALD